jgi:toxin FitB
VSYLLDTNVLSELRRKQPDAQVVHWVESRPASVLYLSVLSVGEIRRGVEALANGRHRTALLDWLEVDLAAFFAGRLLPVDLAVAERWGRLLAHAARPLPAVDSLLAATALHHNMTLVTRNVRDFVAIAGLDVINPWQAPIG